MKTTTDVIAITDLRSLDDYILELKIIAADCPENLIIEMMKGIRILIKKMKEELQAGLYSTKELKYEKR